MNAWIFCSYFSSTKDRPLKRIQIPRSTSYDSTLACLKNRGCSMCLRNFVKVTMNFICTLGKPDGSCLGGRRAHSKSNKTWSDRMQEVGRIGYEIMPHIP